MDATPDTPGEAPEGPRPDLSDLPVRITLAAEGPSLTLAGLRALDVGHLVALGVEPGEFVVRLQAGGEAFGRGRLVSVDGSLAVQILDFEGDA